MKKLLTLAVAAAFAAPLAASAEPTVYGRVNVNMVHEDFDDGSSDAWDVQNNTSRVGVKGSEDLGNGLAAVYQFEFGVDASDTGGLSGRLAYAGITGGFGTFAMGRQWTPYYGSVDKSDIFQTNGMNDEYLGLTRVGNAVAYVTPNFNGLSGKLALVIDNGGAEDVGDDFADWWNLSVDYDNGPLSVGFSYLTAQGSGAADIVDGSLWGLAAKYNFGTFALIGQYETLSDVDGIDADAYAIAGELYLGNNTLRAKYGKQDFDIYGGDYDPSNWVIEAEHNFSKRTRVFVSYEDSEGSYGLTSLGKYLDGDYSSATEHQRFGVGIRHDF
ncbi:MAG: porin [Gammaproteobacteria bacterium]|nr:porin [Gammaproteobacteria bacterium]